MKINKDSLKSRANNLAKELGVSHNIIYDRFFFDAFLARLSSSPYRNTLVLKGGLYLSNVIGIHSRSTMDMDFYLRKMSMEKAKIVSMVTDIALFDIGDGITFDVLGAEDIRQEDIYGGFQVKVRGQLQNVRYEFGIDVATGDPIVPSERDYEYKCLVSGEVLQIKVYSLESVVAEKLQTVLSRQLANSRCKDYYDLYILRKLQFGNIDSGVLKEAFAKTCIYRNFSIAKDNAFALMKYISQSEAIKVRWNSYAKRAKYAQDIAFADIIDAIVEWLEEAL